MTVPSLFFGGNISRNYEDFLGPFLFEPFAVDLAGRLDLTAVGSILELACGSGRLTKHIVEMLPDTVSFTATDLSADMIGVAQSKVTSDRIRWAQADMLALPFEDESFDVVVCQFAVMLVPDQRKALSEIFRILKPGGKVIFSTWTELNYNKVWAIGDNVLKSILGKSPMEFNPGPFALDDKGAVLDMLKKVGFQKMDAALVDCTGKIESAAKAAYGFIYGLPVALFVQKEGPDLMPEILKAMEGNLKAELGDLPLVAPQRALVFDGVK